MPGEEMVALIGAVSPFMVAVATRTHSVVVFRIVPLRGRPTGRHGRLAGEAKDHAAKNNTA